jgi:hypothetical protein
MGLDVFGLEKLCTPEMGIDFTLLSFLQEIGLPVNLMDNYL